MKNVAVLTSPNQWFVPYAEQLAKELECHCYFSHEDVAEEIQVLLILSYHRLIQPENLKCREHNIVIHASDLPQGKGWAPLIWQVIEGKKDIVFSLFEADANADNGLIYLKKTLHLNGFELGDELRKLQAQMCIDMCHEFLQNYQELVAHPTIQSGPDSFYPKRSAKDSQLDLNKTLGEQFNLLRTVDNEIYPAFFIKDNHKYIIKIYHVEA